MFVLFVLLLGGLSWKVPPKAVDGLGFALLLAGAWSVARTLAKGRAEFIDENSSMFVLRKFWPSTDPLYWVCCFLAFATKNTRRYQEACGGHSSKVELGT